MPAPPCPVSRQEFRREAELLTAVISGAQNSFTVILTVKEFSTGSLGWYCNSKISVKLPSGKVVTARLGLNLIIVGSKELPE